jgi:hypothetical protein
MDQHIKAGHDPGQVVVTPSAEEPRFGHSPGQRCLPRTVADDHQSYVRDVSQGFEQVYALFGSEPTDVTNEQTLPGTTGQHSVQRPVPSLGVEQVGIYST